MSVLKDTVLAGIGAVKLARQGASKLVDDLIREGELDNSPTKDKLLNFVEQAEKGSSEFAQRLAEETAKAKTNVSTWSRKIDLATKSEVRNLEAKVDQLTEMVDRLTRDLGQQPGQSGSMPNTPGPGM